ncbi:MAG: alpha/beta fold hydrolase [Proteobacteria bacterium]|nr:alpha/beta fold hydrolase [Pseudomonadota bacterium]
MTAPSDIAAAKRSFRNVAVSYLEAGAANGRPPLVLLHGIGSAARSFRRQLAGLSADRRVIAWDAPGYGGSTPLVPAFPTAEDYAAALESFVDDLGLTRFHLLGHSLGCLMAARFALRHPGRVVSLTLCAIAAGHGRLPGEERQRLLDQRVGDITALGPQEMARRRGPRLLAPGAAADAVAAVIETMGAVRPEGYAQAARMLSTGDIAADIEALPPSLPVQVLYGEADIITPPARNREIAALRPTAPVTAIVDAGHALYLEQPAALNAAVAAFMAEQERHGA